MQHLLTLIRTKGMTEGMCRNSYMSWDILSRVNMENTPTLVTLTICTLGFDSMLCHNFGHSHNLYPRFWQHVMSQLCPSSQHSALNFCQSPKHTTVLYPTCKFAICLPTLILSMPYFNICPAVFWHTCCLLVYTTICSCSTDSLKINFSLVHFSSTLRAYWRQPTSRRLSVMWLVKLHPYMYFIASTNLQNVVAPQ